MRSYLRFGVFIFALVLSNASVGMPLHTVVKSELQRQDRFDMSAARAWKLPALVSFELDDNGKPVIERGYVRLSGWLINASDAPQRIVIFPIGSDGFVLQSVNGAPKQRSGPPLPPPAPLPPMSLVLPPQSRFHVETSFNLSEWEWDIGKPHEMEWSFQFWNEPKPHGRFLIADSPE
jgi:hypothetical protein